MKKFEEVLQSMTGKGVVLAMIAGLEKEHVKVDMYAFAYEEMGVCFGCAATNAICEITGNTEAYIEERRHSNMTPFFSFERLKSINGKIETVHSFEVAVDFLRKGLVDQYNLLIDQLGYHNLFIETKLYLPELTNESYKEQLESYRELANTL